jgi:hypothetical protein
VSAVGAILGVDGGASGAMEQFAEARDLLDLLGVVLQELVLGVTHTTDDARAAANLPSPASL